MGSGRGWLAGDWPSTGSVLNITAAVWTAGFHWRRSGNKKRTQNVSEYMLVLALCLVNIDIGDSVRQCIVDLLFQKIRPCCLMFYGSDMTDLLDHFLKH